MTIRENFARNFDTAIRAFKLKKAHVAKRAKTSRSYIDAVAKNDVSPALDRAEELAACVGLPFQALIVDPKDFENSVLTSGRK